MNDAENLRYFQHAMSFIEAAKSVKTTDELAAAFMKAIRGFGFEGFTCVSFCDFSDAPENAVMLLEYPQDWINYYIDQKYERFDSVLSTNLKQTLPFKWDDDIVLRNATNQQVEIMEEAKQAGILYGFSVPIHAHGALPASVNLVGPNVDVNPAIMHAVHLMSIYLHDAAIKLNPAQKATLRPMVIPTNRERECLQWVAEGKSDSVIAELLGVRQRTVHFHIENIKTKYRVSTRVQAVIRAFLDHQIVPQ